MKPPVWRLLLFFAFCCLFTSQASGQGIALVQHSAKDNGTASTTSVAVTLNSVASGHLLTCSITYGNPGGTTLSVSDNLNGAWAVAGTVHFSTGISQTTAIFYLANSKAGATTITGKPGSAGEYGAMDCQEWSGVATSSPLDQFTEQDGSSANPSSGSVTTGANGELILGDMENGYSPSAGSGFTLLNTDTTAATGSGLDTEYQIQTNAGSVAATWGLAATDWTAQVATFKPAPPAVQGIALVQHSAKDNEATNTSSVAVTLSSVATGHLLTCSITYGNPGGTSLSVSDNVNGAWAVAGTVHFSTGISQATAIFYLANSEAGTTTITGTPGSAGEYGAMDCQEWSGVATSSPLDQFTEQDGSSANPSSGSVTTGANGELILGDMENGYSPSAGSGFTLLNTDTTAATGSGLDTEYQIQTNAGSVAATWGLAATGWTAQVATFKPAAGTSGGPTPSITSVAPGSGAVGTSVTISGTNFGATQSTSTVTFNGTTATPTSWSATSIAAPVPSGATSGNVVVTVGGIASNGVSFTVTSPAPGISSLNPASGAVGSSVTIAGANFGATQSTSTVTFNGTTATPTSWGATSIAVPVPAGATSGNVVVTVGGTASNGVPFTVASSAPTISTLNPTSGAAGASITISGSNFGATQSTSTVTFNGTTATPTSWGATSIAVPVPAGATSGNVVVTVGGTASNGVSFTVTAAAPSVSSLNPTSGAVGTSVTISGANFGATQSTSTVTFNGTAATPTSWSASSITAPVPSGATTGNVEATVGGVASNGVTFTVGSTTAATFTLIQRPQTTNTTCSTTVDTCTLTVASTGSGHLGVVTVGLLAAKNTWVTSVTDSMGSTWTVPGNTGSGGCYMFNGNYGTTGCAYNLSLPAGVTSITATWSSAVPEGSRFDFREYSYTGGGIALDSIGTTQDSSTPVTTITGVTPVLSGTNDVIVQAFSSGSSHATGVTTYGDANIGDSLYGSADLLNTTSTVPPTWSTCCANTIYAAIAIAFKTVGGVSQAATPLCTPGTGTYNNTLSVSCSNPSSAPVLCYTTNGTTPATNGAKGCTNGTVVSGSINIASTGTNLQVVAGGSGVTSSGVASNTYTLAVGAPTFAPPSGSYSGAQSVVISTSTTGASLTYCVDTTNTCTPSTAYGSSVSISSGYLRAQGTLSGFATSVIASAQYQQGTTSASVSLTPALGGATVTQQIPLAATVTNDVGSAGVNWSVSSGGTLAGETTTAATFSATTAGIYTITATSNADINASATATISVTNLAGVYTYHNDLARDGANTLEYALTPSNVNTSTFGKLFSCQVDGAIYTQPLWVANLSFNGVQHNVVFVATQHDSLYAFDADANPCVQLWQVSLIDSAHGANAGETSVPSSGSGHLVGGGTGDITPEVGVTGTPVIDPGSNTLYVVSKSVIASGPTFYQRLHAIDLFTGNEKMGSPLNLTGSNITYPGTGDGSTTDVFTPRTQNQRPGLALVNGVIYVAWASHEDYPAYYGWVIGATYNGTSFSIPYTLNIDPNAHYGGIWMGGAAPSADSSNNLYLITGNGQFDATSTTAPNNDYGDSALQLTSSLTISQYFTPSDQLIDQEDDHDFGSGGATVLADLPVNLSAPSNPTHLLIGGGKDGTLYLLNRDKMGGSGDTSAWQHFPSGHGIFCIGAFWNGTLYIAPINSALEAYALNSSTAMMSTSPSSVSSSTFGFPGASPSVSSNGTADGIVWAINNGNYCTAQSSGCGPAVLHAYSAVPTALGTDLWNSSLVSTDAAGNAVKFTVPTVANGKVYVGTRGNNIGGVYGSTTVSGELDVFGLKPI
jgi:IPT/TIG domain